MSDEVYARVRPLSAARRYRAAMSHLASFPATVALVVTRAFEAARVPAWVDGRRLSAALALVLVASPAAAATGTSPSPSDPPVIVAVETRPAPELAAWFLSPDGASVAGLRGADATEPEAICLFDAVSGQERWCVDAAPGGAPVIDSLTWAPDGSAFVMTERAMQEPDLWRFEAATGMATNLTDDGVSGGIGDFLHASPPPPGTAWYDVMPEIAPDGGSIAFVRIEIAGGESGPARLMVMPPTGGEPVAITDVSPFPNDGLAWSADSARIHWARIDEDGGERVESVGLDGGDPRSAAISVDGSFEPWGGWPYRVDDVLSDGRVLMSESCFITCNFWLVDPGSGIAELFSPRVADDPDERPIAAAASPDGRRVALLVIRRQEPRLEIHDVASGDVRPLHVPELGPGRGRARVMWLPDGRIVVTAAGPGGRNYLLLTLPLAAS